MPFVSRAWRSFPWCTIAFRLSLGAWERRSELVRRVHRLLRRPAETMGARQTQFVTAGLILGVMGGAIALARTPQLISIESPTHEARVAQPADLRYANFGQASMSESAIGAAKIQLIKAVMPERAPQSIEIGFTAISQTQQRVVRSGASTGMRNRQEISSSYGPNSRQKISCRPRIPNNL